ncbi:hypothetical protein [Nannocystis sp. SCPEA4]|uniref:hypothetical protein n=1 Tax=Nannocystis sp. SCPEA4 TaxID=2996787 RepID=UPI00227204D9|nr:hypothetical protein [Nannocystis sp. SCPEA4]MCY1059683.1 hypothetical protein [Nannocystis sp. SCPEA4]
MSRLHGSGFHFASGLALLGLVAVQLWLPARGGSEAAAAPPRLAAEAFDPLAAARAAGTRVANLEASIPPQCYTRTGARSNPCYACHTASQDPNGMNDWHLQEEYAFSDVGRVNHWTNLFVDRRPAVAAIADDELLRHVREDNYAPLREALAGRTDFTGYAPDLDLAAGFDVDGLARDGSMWRTYAWKPFVGAFWPTNGSTGDAFIRLPTSFRTGLYGHVSTDIYKLNLAVLEAAVAAPRGPAGALAWPTEPLDERVVGVDLDRDGELGVATVLRGLPTHYFGAAARHPVRRGVYPAGTEFLHSVRYLDPDAPGLVAARMKELRYARKVEELDRWAIQRAYEEEFDSRQEGQLPRWRGSPEVGLRGDFGWQLQGFIEDAGGRLRLQTAEEHRFCMGCHNGIGVTVDQTFSFPRKLPGGRGWRYQDLRGMADVPAVGHAEPEYLTYMRRVGGGDELRANDEMLARFFPGGVLDETEVRRAAPGGDRDLAWLLAPSRARALALDKAYWLIVREQSFTRGRDATIAPAANVHREIGETATELAAAGTRHLDGRLQLAWPEVAGLDAPAP